MRNDIGCIVMASGLSRRYGKNKLLEDLNGRALILRTADSLTAAGLHPLAVTRSPEVRALLTRAGIACISHAGALKSDTIHAGLEHLGEGFMGYLFMPADQPLVLPASLRRLTAFYLEDPTRAARLGHGETPGSPVIFPAACREALLAYRGDRGGMDVLREQRVPCDIVQAAHAWELWDVDTPEGMEALREVLNGISEGKKP